MAAATVALVLALMPPAMQAAVDARGLPAFEEATEHHTGRAVDVMTPGGPILEEAFEDTDAFRWLARHACRFGFRLSYPRGNAHGFAYEPWHWAWHPKPLI